MENKKIVKFKFLWRENIIACSEQNLLKNVERWKQILGLTWDASWSIIEDTPLDQLPNPLPKKIKIIESDGDNPATTISEFISSQTISEPRVSSNTKKSKTKSKTL